MRGNSTQGTTSSGSYLAWVVCEVFSEVARTGSENGFVREDLLPLVFQVLAREYDGDIGEVWGVVEAICISDGALLGVLSLWILTIGTTSGRLWRP